MKLDAQSLYEELLEKGTRWADADAAYRALEDSRPGVLARIAAPLLDAGKPASYAEIKAKAHAGAGEHLAALAQARQEANLSKVRYDVFRVYIELLRTQAANERAEMQL